MGITAEVMPGDGGAKMARTLFRTGSRHSVALSCVAIADIAAACETGGGQQIVGPSLRIRRRFQDEPFVVAQGLEPGANISGVIFEVVGSETQRCAENRGCAFRQPRAAMAGGGDKEGSQHESGLSVRFA
jgi:hypothetical protein